jgi:hypothetical protein
MKKTCVIVRDEKENVDGHERSDLWYFLEWRWGLPVWGRDKKDAKTFESKEEAKQHLPGMRHRKTAFGSHYVKGIKIESL